MQSTTDRHENINVDITRLFLYLQLCIYNHIKDLRFVEITSTLLTHFFKYNVWFLNIKIQRASDNLQSYIFNFGEKLHVVGSCYCLFKETCRFLETLSACSNCLILACIISKLHAVVDRKFCSKIKNDYDNRLFKSC